MTKYKIEPQEYFSNIFKFLKNDNDNKINVKNLIYYIFVIFIIVTLGQIAINKSDPYISDNIENEKFIKSELKSQIIFDTIALTMKQTYFKTYFAIVMTDGSTYRLNLENSENKDKITKKAIIEKKANDKTFEIITNDAKYKFEISSLNNYREKIIVFFGTLFFSIIGIPICLKKNELEKEYEKNSR